MKTPDKSHGQVLLLSANKKAHTRVNNEVIKKEKAAKVSIFKLNLTWEKNWFCSTKIISSLKQHVFTAKSTQL